MRIEDLVGEIASLKMRHRAEIEEIVAEKGGMKAEHDKLEGLLNGALDHNNIL